MTSKKTFDAGSPGFLYTIIASVLTIGAISGIQWGQSPEMLADNLVTTLSTGGVFALAGLIVSSVVFPAWNAYKKGLKTIKEVFSSTLTWIALGNILLAGLALTGFTLPEGTVDQIVAAAFSKDWNALISILFTTIIPTIVRFIKDKA